MNNQLPSAAHLEMLSVRSKSCKESESIKENIPSSLLPPDILSLFLSLALSHSLSLFTPPS